MIVGDSCRVHKVNDRHTFALKPSPSAWETGLPVDLLLEIVARTDVTTVVRSAATCRLFRRAILDPASRSRLAADKDGTGFDPALLLGVSYREYERVTTFRWISCPRWPGAPTLQPASSVARRPAGSSALQSNSRLTTDPASASASTPPSSSASPATSTTETPPPESDTSYRIIHTPAPDQLRVRLDAGSLRNSFSPVASRDRLVLLERYGCLSRPRRPYFDLRVCDVLTGHVTDLPPIYYLSYAFQDVFLSIGDGDAEASFELLVIENSMRFHTFSAKEGRWGAVRQASLPSDHADPSHNLCTSRPAVIGRTLYWSYCTTGSSYWDGIFALDVDAAEATMMKLPPAACVRKVFSLTKDKRLRVVSVGGRLSVLVSDMHGITIWTMTPASSGSAATWSQRLVIGVQEIQRQAGDLVRATRLPVILEEFGERSGTVIFHLDCGELFRLDLGTNQEEASVVRMIKIPGSACLRGLFLHETDLISLLQAMKSF